SGEQRMRDRFALPILLPILVVGAIGLAIFSFGYVLLEVQHSREAWPVAIAVAGAILIVAWFIYAQPSVRGWPLYAMTALPAAVILSIGMYYLIRPAPEHAAEGGEVAAVIAPPGPLSEVATDNAFSETEYTIVAGQQYTLNFSNQGAALHNWAVLDVQGADGQPIKTQLLPGGQSETLNFTIAQPGTYQFHCEVHPVEMVGELTVVDEATAAAAASGGASGGGAGSPGPGSITQVATDNKFSQTQLSANANEQTSLTLRNDGSAIHNWHVTGVTGANGQPIQTTLLPGGQSETIQFTIGQAGTYNFLCDVHPTEMTGRITVN
ncbi:MAG: cupredoxin domain-containing protein, partial [Dehalococcoidia bacterium]